MDLICQLRRVSRPETLVPLRLTGGAFAIYQQLPTLLTSLSLDSFTALRTLFAQTPATRRIRGRVHGGAPKTGYAFRRTSRKGAHVAFVAGLPDAIRQKLKCAAIKGIVNLSTLRFKLREAKVIFLSDIVTDLKNQNYVLTNLMSYTHFLSFSVWEN